MSTAILSTSKINLTGGIGGFRRAVDEAFSSGRHNSCVRYSRAQGFFATSALDPAEEGVLWECRVFHSLDTMGNCTKRSIANRDYLNIRRQIAKRSGE
jgi:hypothetical protein